MSTHQYGLPAFPAGEDIPQDTVVKLDDGEWFLVAGPDDIDDDTLVGISDTSANQGDSISPKRGSAVDYARVNGEVEIEVGDKLQVADDGEVGAFDGEVGSVCIGRAASRAVTDRLVRVEFATLMEVGA